tara:strand:- start:638 stop:751 length:114 start_codon:yes stop_codon:yes gene_type:complete
MTKEQQAQLILLEAEAQEQKPLTPQKRAALRKKVLES